MEVGGWVDDSGRQKMWLVGGFQRFCKIFTPKLGEMIQF